jgi:hypothetical protein
MTPEAKAKAEKLRSEGKDPITGRNPDKKSAPCPACEIKKAAETAKAEPPSGNKPAEGKGGAA